MTPQVITESARTTWERVKYWTCDNLAFHGVIPQIVATMLEIASAAIWAILLHFWQSLSLSSDS